MAAGIHFADILQSRQVHSRLVHRYCFLLSSGAKKASPPLPKSKLLLVFKRFKRKQCLFAAKRG